MVQLAEFREFRGCWAIIRGWALPIHESFEEYMSPRSGLLGRYDIVAEVNLEEPRKSMRRVMMSTLFRLGDRG